MRVTKYVELDGGESNPICFSPLIFDDLNLFEAQLGFLFNDLVIYIFEISFNATITCSQLSVVPNLVFKMTFERTQVDCKSF